MASAARSLSDSSLDASRSFLTLSLELLTDSKSEEIFLSSFSALPALSVSSSNFALASSKLRCSDLWLSRVTSRSLRADSRSLCRASLARRDTSSFSVRSFAPALASAVKAALVSSDLLFSWSKSRSKSAILRSWALHVSPREVASSLAVEASALQPSSSPLSLPTSSLPLCFSPSIWSIKDSTLAFHSSSASRRSLAHSSRASASLLAPPSPSSCLLLLSASIATSYSALPLLTSAAISLNRTLSSSSFVVRSASISLYLLRSCWSFASESSLVLRRRCSRSKTLSLASATPASSHFTLTALNSRRRAVNSPFTC